MSLSDCLYLQGEWEAVGSRGAKSNRRGKYCLQAGNQGGCKCPRGKETITTGWNQPPVKAWGDNPLQGETHQQTIQSVFLTSLLTSLCTLILYSAINSWGPQVSLRSWSFDPFVSCKHSCTCCLPGQGVWRVPGWWDKDQLIMSPQWEKAVLAVDSFSLVSLSCWRTFSNKFLLPSLKGT